MTPAAPSEDIAALAKGGRTNVFGFLLRLAARLPFLFIAGRLYGPDVVGRFAVAVLAVEFAALIATLGLKRGLAEALSQSERPHAHVAWDGLAVAGVASAAVASILVAFPQLMFPNSGINRFDRLLPLAIFALAWSDVSLAALAYRRNIRASVTARAIIEPWTISIAAFALSYYSLRDGLILSYALSTVAALIMSLWPFVRSYGWPRDWRPRVAPLFTLAWHNAPLAGADALEWATRNVDRFILSLLFAPSVVGIYYMAQQVASIPQKLKTSFDPILGPVITHSLAENDRAAIAQQVRQVGFWILAAQAGLAVMGSVPAKGVMGVVGPQFVAGALALVFLLIAETFAVTASVCESALVYMARTRNLAISMSVLAIQIILSFAIILGLRAWYVPAKPPIELQIAGAALALAVALGLGSIAKAILLRRLLGAPVSPVRPRLFGAVAVATIIGLLMTRFAEWAEILIGEPLMFIGYCAVIWFFAFTAADRALFRRSTVNAESAASP